MKREVIEFLPATLEIQEKPPSPAGRSVAWSIMLFFTLVVAWALIGEIDIVANAQGRIVPGDRVKVIQPIEIGNVRFIAVQEGQRVQTGDLLVELDATINEADLERLNRELLALQLDQARYRQLLALIKAAASASAPTQTAPAYQPPVAQGEATEPAILELQSRLLQSAWKEHQARIAVLTSTLEARRAEYAETREEIGKLKATLPLITRRADALKMMVDKQLGPEQAWLELEEKRITQQQDLAVENSRLQQMAASIREAEQQRQALDEQFRRELLTQLSDIERRREQLEQETIKARRRTGLQRLTSPVDGVVQQLAVHTIGGVVTPAQELMKIVPENEPLEVEAWVLNKDIGFVHEGQRAEIKIETFPFTRYGTIDAEILDVSNDAVGDEKQGLVYAARVLMEKSVIQVGEKLVNLTPGMAVTVEVKTGKRRLIEFVLSPLLHYKQESLGER